MKLTKVIPFLMLATANAQMFHDLESSAYIDAANRLNCSSDLIVNREGLIEVTEPDSGRIYVIPPSVSIWCPDPVARLNYGPLPVHGQDADWYRIMWWHVDDWDGGEPVTHETSRIAYDLPVDNIDNYVVIIEAFEPFDGVQQRSLFYRLNGGVFVLEVE